MSRGLAFSSFVLASLAACAPAIGDDCESSVDCSLNGDRICDISYPDGYCTVPSCEMDTCPDDAVCVQFRFEPPRLASSQCMAPCEADGDCRDSAYQCVSAAEITADGQPLARVLDASEHAFCIARGED
jgi:hypothetical protein